MKALRMARVALVALALAPGFEQAAVAGKLRVALYAEPVCTDDRCREAAARALAEDPSLAVERVTSATIRSGNLADFDALVIPGGTANGIARSLGVEGGRRVTEFVRSGGGLVGVCAGGYLVVEGWSPETRAVETINATSWDDDHWARGEGFIAVKTADTAETSHTIWFENGPIFVPGKLPLPAYTPLVRYVTDLAAKDAPRGMMTGRDAVIAAPFGKGRVVAFGPHAELTPGLHHWLCNAVRWSAGEGPETPSVRVTLERANSRPASR